MAYFDKYEVAFWDERKTLVTYHANFVYIGAI